MAAASGASGRMMPVYRYRFPRRDWLVTRQATINYARFIAPANDAAPISIEFPAFSLPRS